ncbi:MAG: glycosyltransferase family 2 protein [Crocinitomicaceae bacterium]|nr:glycosyltransferase family 2 protein [Crocinitomicaceae bacterium]
MQFVFSFIIYFLAFVFLMYAVLQFRLGCYFLKSLKLSNSTKKNIQKNDWPCVTIQLPVYNEINMILSLLKTVDNIDYPKELLQIQILDDSTDNTSNLIEGFLNQNNRHNFFHLKRSSRHGFKAGALQQGLFSVTGEYIAIFDADFLPPKDFLYKTLPYFTENNIAFVQTRWGHANEKKSMLTRIQALTLDMHFTVEQGGRFCSGDFIQFNGTAGVIKKSVIKEAGGWSSDTVVEDLDLSFRIQLLGYKGVYAKEIVCPAELPTTFGALRIQQTRWIGGGAACFKKLNKKIIFSSAVPFSKRFFALFHLFHSSMFLFVFPMLLYSVFSGFFGVALNEFNLLAANLIFKFSLCSLIFIYGISFWLNERRKWNDLPFFVGSFFLFFALNFAFSFNHFIAVLKGYNKKGHIFHRTPKNKLKSGLFLYKNIENRWALTIIEILLLFLFVFLFLFSLKNRDYSFSSIHLLSIIGYVWMIFNSFIKKSLKS